MELYIINTNGNYVNLFFNYNRKIVNVDIWKLFTFNENNYSKEKAISSKQSNIILINI